MSIKNNTTSLQSILEALSNKASGGGGISEPVEMCTVKLNLISNNFFDCEMYVMLFDKSYVCTSEEGFYPFIDYYLGMGNPYTLTIEIPKNSIIYVCPSTASHPVTESVIEEGSAIYMGTHYVYNGRGAPDVNYETFFVYGDCAITATFEE